MADVAEAWFERAISVGLSRLAALQLVGTPPDAQTASACRAVWVDALWDGRAWDQTLDASRIEAAFSELARGAVRWPAPAQFLEALPARRALPRLESPPASIEDRERIRAMLEGLRRKIMGGNP